MWKLILTCLAAIFLTAYGCTRPPRVEMPPEPEPQVRQKLTNEKLRAEVGKLVEKLGAEEYREREAAQKKLSRMLRSRYGGIVLKYLRVSPKAASDPEVAQRLERILKPYNDWQVTPEVLNAFPDIVEFLEKVPGECAKSVARAINKRELTDTGNAPAIVLKLLIQTLLKRVNHAAVGIVVDIGEPAAEPLVALLEDDDVDVRHFAARVLAEMGDPRAAGFLVKALKEGSDFVTADTLVKLGPYALDALAGALKDNDEGVRWSSALALGEIRDKRAVEALVEALKDNSSRVRWVVVESLGKVGDKKATGALMEVLGDKDKYVREFAAKALGKIGDENAVKPLIEALGDDIWQVRWSVAHALGEIGGKGAIEPLIESLKDKEYRVRKAAAEALSKITDYDFFLDYKEWKQWYEKNKDE
jgi:HEAT repeat protein